MVIVFVALSLNMPVMPQVQASGTDFGDIGSRLEGGNCSLTEELEAVVSLRRNFLEVYGIKADFKLCNKRLADRKAIMILALYDSEGKLLRSHNQTLTLSPGGVKQADLKISLSLEEQTKFKSARAFVWDANTLRPLTSVVQRQDMFGEMVETLTKATTFDGFDVGLKGDSYFKEQLETGAKYLKYYEPDRLAASLYINNFPEKSPAEPDRKSVV